VLLEDQEHGTESKSKKHLSNPKEFLENTNSDLSFEDSYRYKNELPAIIADSLFNASIGSVFGPYKDSGYFKLSKLIEIVQLPDSVKSSHIIVSFSGTQRSFSTKTKEEAKVTIDSIFELVKNNKTKFAEIANEINVDGTKGKGGEIGWIRKNQAFSTNFDRDFANYIYKNKTGSIGIVETAFGFHIIRINEQTKLSKAIKIATFARLIEASEDTENTIFQQAETLAANLADGKLLEDLAKENNYTIQSALNLKVLDEAVPGLGNQRQIVTWAFDKETNLGYSKRFDVDYFGKRGYAVVVLKGKTEEGKVALNSDILNKIRPELINKKKAALIKEKMKGATLEEIAKNNTTTVRTASLVTLASPLLSGVGNEPAVVGAMFSLKLNEISNTIEGKKGVFVVKVTKRDTPVALDNYDNFRSKILSRLKGRSFQLYQILEESADIKDNRGKFY